MARSVYEHVWNAMEDQSAKSREAALYEIEGGVEDPVEQMVLRAMVWHELAPRQDGIAKIGRYVTENSVRVRTNLAAMDIAVAFPDFIDGTLPGDLDVLRPRTIGVATPNYFVAEGDHTTNNRLGLSAAYRLRTHRVIRGTTDPEVARQLAQPEAIPHASLVIGYEAVKAFATSVQEWASEYPDSPAPIKKQDVLRAAMGEDFDALPKRDLPVVSLD